MQAIGGDQKVGLCARIVVEAQRLAPELHGLMFHKMVFGFPAGELMLSIPMPRPSGERCCHFVWFRPLTESALDDLCTDEDGRRHGVSIPPPLIRRALIDTVKRDANASLAPQLRALVHATAQIILHPIFDLESPCIAFQRVALIGDAAFVARPHVASGVMKAAVDAETLTDVLAAHGANVSAALDHYNRERQPYGAWLVERGRHIGNCLTEHHADPAQRIETIMREYGSAGVVHAQPIVARVLG
jgi:2-polyprenyl-6-methoxyphenol hydroxylase-like FAD-dependent oxidoreductase